MKDLDEEKRLHLKEISRNAIASLSITAPTLIQSYMYGTLFYAFSFAGMSLLIFSFVSYFKINLKLLSPLIIISFYNAVLMVSFGRIFGQFDYLATINATLPEMLAFITANRGKIFILVGSTLLFVVYLRYFIWTDRGLKWVTVPTYLNRKSMLPLLFISLIPFPFAKQQELLSSYPFACAYDLIIANEFNIKASKYSSLPYEFRGKPPSEDEYATFILVIGESARRDFFGFNHKGNGLGYSPEMDKLAKEHPNNLVIFDNYISTGQSTVPSVLTMLSPSGTSDILHSYDKPNLLKLLHGAGYCVSVIDGQDCGLINDYFSIAGERHTFMIGSDDQEMVRVVKEKMVSQNAFIVLHTKGSHIGYCGAGLDNYIRSIRDTDSLLKELFRTIIDSRTPTCGWYVSDHGENIHTGDVHGSGNITLDELEVPSIIMANDIFINKYPKSWKNLNNRRKYLSSHANLSHTVLGLTNTFPEGYYIPKQDISSDYFMEDENPLLMPNNMIPIRYLNVFKAQNAHQQK